MALTNFGKKREQRKRKEVNKKQMDLAQKNRESANRLVAALRVAKANASGIASIEGRRVFSNVSDTFISFLDNSKVIAQYDVAEIDKILAEMIDLYNEALKQGDIETAKHGVERIHAGLLEFRKELTMEEAVHKEDVLAKRVQNLSEYKEVILLSSKVFINRKNVEDKEKEYVEYMKNYEKLYADVEEQTKTRPDLYEFLKDYRPGIDPMNPDAAEMHTNIEKLNILSKQVDDLKQTMEIFKREYNEQSAQLDSLKTMLSIKDGLLTQEDMDILDKAIESYREHLQDAMNEVSRLRALHEKRHSITSNIFSSMDFGKELVENVREYEKLKRRHELRQEGIAEGQRLKNEEQLNEHGKQVLTH